MMRAAAVLLLTVVAAAAAAAAGPPPLPREQAYTVERLRSVVEDSASAFVVEVERAWRPVGDAPVPMHRSGLTRTTLVDGLVTHARSVEHVVAGRHERDEHAVRRTPAAYDYPFVRRADAMPAFIEGLAASAPRPAGRCTLHDEARTEGVCVAAASCRAHASFGPSSHPSAATACAAPGTACCVPAVAALLETEAAQGPVSETVVPQRPARAGGCVAYFPARGGAAWATVHGTCDVACHEGVFMPRSGSASPRVGEGLPAPGPGAAPLMLGCELRGEAVGCCLRPACVQAAAAPGADDGKGRATPRRAGTCKLAASCGGASAPSEVCSATHLGSCCVEPPRHAPRAWGKDGAAPADPTPRTVRVDGDGDDLPPPPKAAESVRLDYSATATVSLERRPGGNDVREMLLMTPEQLEGATALPDSAARPRAWAAGSRVARAKEEHQRKATGRARPAAEGKFYSHQKVAYYACLDSDAGVPGVAALGGAAVNDRYAYLYDYKFSARSLVQSSSAGASTFELGGRVRITCLMPSTYEALEGLSDGPPPPYVLRAEFFPTALSTTGKGGRPVRRAVPPPPAGSSADAVYFVQHPSSGKLEIFGVDVVQGGLGLEQGGAGPAGEPPLVRASFPGASEACKDDETVACYERWHHDVRRELYRDMVRENNKRRQLDPSSFDVVVGALRMYADTTVPHAAGAAPEVLRMTTSAREAEAAAGMDNDDGDGGDGSLLEEDAEDEAAAAAGSLLETGGALDSLRWRKSWGGDIAFSVSFGGKRKDDGSAFLSGTVGVKLWDLTVDVVQAAYLAREAAGGGRPTVSRARDRFAVKVLGFSMRKGGSVPAMAHGSLLNTRPPAPWRGFVAPQCGPYSRMADVSGTLWSTRTLKGANPDGAAVFWDVQIPFLVFGVPFEAEFGLSGWASLGTGALACKVTAPVGGVDESTTRLSVRMSLDSAVSVFGSVAIGRTLKWWGAEAVLKAGIRASVDLLSLQAPVSVTLGLADANDVTFGAVPGVSTGSGAVDLFYDMRVGGFSDQGTQHLVKWAPFAERYWPRCKMLTKSGFCGTTSGDCNFCVGHGSLAPLLDRYLTEIGDRGVPVDYARVLKWRNAFHSWALQLVDTTRSPADTLEATAGRSVERLARKTALMPATGLDKLEQLLADRSLATKARRLATLLGSRLGEAGAAPPSFFVALERVAAAIATGGGAADRNVGGTLVPQEARGSSGGSSRADALWWAIRGAFWSSPPFRHYHCKGATPFPKCGGARRKAALHADSFTCKTSNGRSLGAPAGEKWTGASCEAPRAGASVPPIIGFGPDLDKLCGAPASSSSTTTTRTCAANCVSRGFNRLHVSDANWNECVNLHWVACAASGHLPGTSPREPRQIRTTLHPSHTYSNSIVSQEFCVLRDVCTNQGDALFWGSPAQRSFTCSST